MDFQYKSWGKLLLMGADFYAHCPFYFVEVFPSILQLHILHVYSLIFLLVLNSGFLFFSSVTRRSCLRPSSWLAARKSWIDLNISLCTITNNWKIYNEISGYFARSQFVCILGRFFFHSICFYVFKMLSLVCGLTKSGRLSLCVSLCIILTLLHVKPRGLIYCCFSKVCSSTWTFSP